jgi:hypothetical protein
MTRSHWELLLFDSQRREKTVNAPKTHFEQISVQRVKKMMEQLPPQAESVIPTAAGAPPEDWRELARRAQLETDSNKMIHLVQQLIARFDEEKGSRIPKPPRRSAIE